MSSGVLEGASPQSKTGRSKSAGSSLTAGRIDLRTRELRRPLRDVLLLYIGGLERKEAVTQPVLSKASRRFSTEAWSYFIVVRSLYAEAEIVRRSVLLHGAI